MDRKNIDPVVQILPKSTFRHHGLEILVGGGDQAHIGLLAHRTANRTKLPLLNNAQQFGLRGQRNVAKLVHEQGSVVGNVKHAPLVRHCAGKGTFCVAEQFAFQQIFTQRIAVNRDKGLVLAQAVVVNGAGNHLFSSSALARDQHRAVGRRTFSDKAKHRLHGCTRSDDVLKPVLRANLAFEVTILL